MSDATRRELLTMMAGAAIPGAPQPPSWPAFKARYLAPEGRIVDTGNGGISHTEGQGYGLVLTAAAGDRAGFDQLWRWTRTTLAREDGLFSWRFDPAAAQPVSDRNNATDGDLLIAWGLARGAARWRDRDALDGARRILAAAGSRLVVPSALGPVLLPGLDGFQAAATVTVNPAYWIWPALAAFQALEPSGPWSALQASGEALLDAAAFGSARLPTDWVQLGADAGVQPANVQPAAGRPPRFGFDAVRTPLYLAWSGRWPRLAAYQAFWGPELAAGRTPPAWLDVTSGETAPYPLAPGAAAIARWTCGREPGTLEPRDYYSDVLAVLVETARREAGAPPARAALGAPLGPPGRKWI